MVRYSSIHQIYTRSNKRRGKGISNGGHLSKKHWISNNIFINANNLFYSDVTDNQRIKYYGLTESIDPPPVSGYPVITSGPSPTSNLYIPPSAYPEHSAEKTYLITRTGQNTRANGLMIFHNTVKMVRILGLMALISYMVVILSTWIYANLGGYVYFSAGEPLLFIKYSEWALGFTGILVAVDLLLKEIK